MANGIAGARAPFAVALSIAAEYTGCAERLGALRVHLCGNLRRDGYGVARRRGIPGIRQRALASLESKPVAPGNIPDTGGRPATGSTGDVGQDTSGARAQSGECSGPASSCRALAASAPPRHLATLHERAGCSLRCPRERRNMGRWIVIGGGTAVSRPDSGGDESGRPGAEAARWARQPASRSRPISPPAARVDSAGRSSAVRPVAAPADV